jgi:hypothetical protein
MNTRIPATYDRAVHPADLPLRLYRGDSYAFVLRVLAPGGAPADLSGATAAGEVHANAGAGALILECAVEAPNLVRVTLPASEWSNPNPPAAAAPARYDVQLTFADGRVYTLVAGAVTILADVTQ